jgi:hypothetical protein
MSRHTGKQEHGFVVFFSRTSQDYVGEHHDYPEHLYVHRPTPEEALKAIKANVEALKTDTAIRHLVEALANDPERKKIVVAQLTNGQTSLQPGVYLDEQESRDLYVAIHRPMFTTGHAEHARIRLLKSVKPALNALGITHDSINTAQKLELQYANTGWNVTDDKPDVEDQGDKPAQPTKRPWKLTKDRLNQIHAKAQAAAREVIQSAYFGETMDNWESGVSGGLGGDVGELAGALDPATVSELILAAHYAFDNGYIQP